MSTRFACRNTSRLRILKESTLVGTPNAIEYVEVRDNDEPLTAMKQRTLYVRTVHPLPGTGAADEIEASNVAISGGDRIRTVAVTGVARADAPTPPWATAAEWASLTVDVDEPDHVLVVRTAERGDFSTYTLALVAAGTGGALAGFDPLLSEIGLQFKVECPTDLDCAAEDPCVVEAPAPAPRIDYLAKDYTGFRRIMLERLAQLSPSWSERNPADIGITLVELLAYAADAVSWRQDAIATEAYLGTARSRVSLRRHARLVDYRVHEGCSARAFVRVQTTAATANLAAGTVMFTSVPGIDETVGVGSQQFDEAMRSHPEVFATLDHAVLHKSCAEMELWAWGDPDACLAKGATSATIAGHPDVEVGDVIVLVETADPSTGEVKDRDPDHRVAVRLTEVAKILDEAGGLFASPPSLTPVPVTRVAWHAEDALPRSMPLYHRDSGTALVQAWGNIVLVDHGLPVSGEIIDPADPRPAKAPLAHVLPAPAAGASAAEILRRPDPRSAVPDIKLTGTHLSVVSTWSPRRDLFPSSGIDRHFVVECEHDRTAAIRFGGGRHGKVPDDGTTFTADYRIGGGVSGNVGAESIRHIATGNSSIIGVGNPLPAAGGTDPETADEVRRDAPEAFLVQERAVTPADYSELAQRVGGVQSTATTFRWTGSWHTVFLTADRLGGAALDAGFAQNLRDWLEKYRMAGYDLDVDVPVFVPLEIDLLVCVGEQILRSDIAALARDALSTKVNQHGTRGLFHPDHHTFGSPVYLSSVYAALHALEGVESVSVTTFQRLGQPATSGLASGVLRMQRREIARLDNDPSFPERGQLTIRLGGGR